MTVREVGIELNQSMFLNAEGAEEFAEERKGQHFSASFAKTSAYLCVKLGSSSN